MSLKEILEVIKKMVKSFFSRIPKRNSKSIDEKFMISVEEILDSLEENKESFLNKMKAFESLQERYKVIMRKMYEE